MGIFAAIQKGAGTAKKCLSLAALLTLLYGGLFVLNNTLDFSSGFRNLPENPDPKEVGRVILMSLFGMALTYFFQAFVQAGLIATAGEKIKAGSYKIADFFVSAARFCLKVFAQAFLVMVFFFMCVVMATVLMALAAKIKALSAVLAIMFGVIVVYAATLLSLAPYLIVLERKSIFGSMSESASFVKDRFWRFLALQIVTVLALILIMALFVTLVWLVSLAIQGVTFAVIAAFISALMLFSISWYSVLYTSAIIHFYYGNQAS